MNGNQIEGAWQKARRRLRAQWRRLFEDDRTRAARRCEARVAFLRERYRLSEREARRRTRDWMRDPGVLDDWNDTRSILDM